MSPGSSGWNDRIVVPGGVPVNAAPCKDTEAPKVSVTVPAAGATLTGPAVLTATVSDNVGVVGVQFFVDGANFGEALVAPYSVSFNSAILANGNHTITAKAWDAAGNSSDSASLTVSVRNAAPPASGPAPATAPPGE